MCKLFASKSRMSKRFTSCWICERFNFAAKLKDVDLWLRHNRNALFFSEYTRVHIVSTLKLFFARVCFPAACLLYVHHLLVYFVRPRSSLREFLRKVDDYGKSKQKRWKTAIQLRLYYCSFACAMRKFSHTVVLFFLLSLHSYILLCNFNRSIK